MIDISKLKKGDVFYKADINGVWECTMDDEEVQKFGSFGVKIKERGDKLGIITKEDYDYIFYTMEEAEEAKKSFPTSKEEELMEGNNWIEALFYTYKTYMQDSYVDSMRRVIEKKTGMKL